MIECLANLVFAQNHAFWKAFGILRAGLYTILKGKNEEVVGQKYMPKILPYLDFYIAPPSRLYCISLKIIIFSNFHANIRHGPDAQRRPNILPIVPHKSLVLQPSHIQKSIYQKLIKYTPSP